MTYHIAALTSLPPEVKVRAITASKFYRLLWGRTNDHGHNCHLAVLLPGAPTVYGHWRAPYFYCEVVSPSGSWYPFRLTIPAELTHQSELTP